MTDKQQNSLPPSWFGVICVTAAVPLFIASHAGAHWVTFSCNHGNLTEAHASPWEACNTEDGRRCGDYLVLLDLNNQSIDRAWYLALIIMTAFAAFTLLVSFLSACTYLCCSTRAGTAVTAAVFAIFSVIFTVIVLALFGADVNHQEDVYSKLIPDPVISPRICGSLSWGYYILIAEIGCLLLAAVLFIAESHSLKSLAKSKDKPVLRKKPVSQVSTIEVEKVHRHRPPSNEWKPIFPEMIQDDLVMTHPPQA